MIDPPRAESLDAVKAAQDANIRVRMVTGDDVVTGAAVAKQLGIPGEAILGTELAAHVRGGAPATASTTSASSVAWRPSTRC